MIEVVISDASCLILLQKIGHLSILQKLFQKVIITPEIANEILFAVPDWIEIQSPNNKGQQKILQTMLDKGESSAITICLENANSILLIDERKGRIIAESLGVKIKGSLGVLIDAKKAGLILALKPILREIAQTNFRISEELIKFVLQEVKEL